MQQFATATAALPEVLASWCHTTNTTCQQFRNGMCQCGQQQQQQQQRHCLKGMQSSSSMLASTTWNLQILRQMGTGWTAAQQATPHYTLNMLCSCDHHGDS
jgi:ATP:corrinoid adenosyltransferase